MPKLSVATLSATTHRYPARLCILAVVLSVSVLSGCVKQKTRDQGRVRVWPPNREESGVAKFEISDESDGAENPRARITQISDSGSHSTGAEKLNSGKESRGETESMALASRAQDRDAGSQGRSAAAQLAAAFRARSDRANNRSPNQSQSDDKLASGDISSTTPTEQTPAMPDERLTAQQTAALARQMAIYEAFNGKTPPVSQFKDTDIQEMADTEQSDVDDTVLPQASKSKDQFGALDLSVAKDSPELKRIPAFPSSDSDTPRVSTVQYQSTDEHPMRDVVEEVTPAGYDTQPEAPTPPQPANSEPADSGEPNDSSNPEATATASRYEATAPSSGTPAAGPTPVDASTAAEKTTDPVGPSTENPEPTSSNPVANPVDGGSAESDVDPTVTQDVGTANTPAGQSTDVMATATEGDWRANIYASLDQLQRQIAHEPDLIAKQRLQASHRILSALVNDREKALRPIDDASPQSQRYWTEQSLALITMLDPHGSPQDSRRARLAGRHLKQAQRQLAAASGLDVRNVSFCQQVMGYGWFKEFEPSEFLADQEVILYAELENFSYGEGKEGFETEFQGGYQIFDQGGRRVAEHDFLPVKQVCRNVQTDYFLPYRMHIPKHLSPGNYRLQLTIEDRKGNKFGQSLPIDFTVKE